MRNNNTERRYDIDWLRVIAIGFLIIYHVAIGFQSWGLMVGFITNKESWASLWTPMSLLNIWRIPLLFFISGMGVFFALQKRNWFQLIKERSRRILLPFVFGMIVIVPVHLLILQKYYDWNLSYSPGSSHLWFLANIFTYTLSLLPLFIYIKNNMNGRFVHALQSVFSAPFGLLIIMGCFVAEAVLVKPMPYALYAMTVHGYVLGLMAFFFGYIFVLSGKPFLTMILTWRWLYFVTALLLYFYRINQGQWPTYLLSIESNLWIFSVLAFGHKYLNTPSRALRYFSQSAYPVYVIHMIVLYSASYLIMPWNMDVKLKFLWLVLLTLTGSLGIYELLIRRSDFLRPVFGLKVRKQSAPISNPFLKQP